MASRTDSFAASKEGSSSMRSSSSKKRAYSVSAAIAMTNSILKDHTFVIEGEVSELSNKPGYKAVYFTIKDEDASLPCLIWKDKYRASGVDLRIGLKVQISGKFNIYAPKGRMNFNAFHMVLAGLGDLQARVAMLAEKLRKEGLMAPSRKRALPYLPVNIGLVTSPNGAVVHDVLRTLRRRYPLARVIFAGVNVEGARASKEMAEALMKVAATEAEVILLVRGGGSLEEFMPFNDETLARTIASCPKPIVTGIGHEPDTTIADMVSDFRATSPTGAAEAVSPTTEELFDLLTSRADRLSSSLMNRISRSRVFIEGIASRPLFKDPSLLYSSEMQSIDVFQDKMDFLAKTLLRRDTHSVELASLDLVRIGRSLLTVHQSQAAVATSRLHDLSPLKTLERGWSIARDEQGAIVKSVSQVDPDDLISVQLIDGALSCRVEEEVPSELCGMISLEEPND